MYRYLIKYGLFFLPFMFLLWMELCVLPLDYFTFRVWEAIKVQRSFGILQGPFYPNMILTKTEEGDLAYYTPCAVTKEVTWITDQYGFRKANKPLSKHSVVIVGDSSIAGSALSQEQLLSEMLENKLNITVYPLAPDYPHNVFVHGPFRKQLPDIVILAITEREIPEELLPLESIKLDKSSTWSDLVLSSKFNGTLQQVAVLLDRICKANMLNYYRARINETGTSEQHSPHTKECSMLFFQGAEANKDAPQQRYELTVQRIKEYSDFFTSRGMRFIFFPIPNKETIYYEYLKTKRPEFLERLIGKLRELNVEAVDTPQAFWQMHKKTTALLYHRDDSHWNAFGVKVAADKLAEQIKKQPLPLPR